MITHRCCHPNSYASASQVVGDGRCPIVDTWWQTETGAHMITPLPGATTLVPGSATLPFFGVEPAVLDEKGEELQGECEGCAAWPFLEAGMTEKMAWGWRW